MKVLIIGGTRNVGHLLALALLEAGHQVTVFNRGQTVDELPSAVTRIHGDRNAPAGLVQALAAAEYDAVVDMVLYDGVQAQRTVAQLAGRTGHYVFISTGQVYLVRDGLARPFVEADYDGGTPVPEPAPGTYDHEEWLYGVDKRTAEDLLARAWQEERFPVTTLRLPMVNSERDHFLRLYNYLLRIRDGEPILVPNAPQYPLRHVYGHDVVRAVLALLTRGPDQGQVFNISQDETLALSDWLAMLADCAGATPAPLLEVPRAPTGARRPAAGLFPLQRYLDVGAGQRAQQNRTRPALYAAARLSGAHRGPPRPAVAAVARRLPPAQPRTRTRQPAMTPDAIVVGAGPNGLAAAITLAQAGLQVRVYEAQQEIGGGLRSAELTLPGFTHDLCSAVHPLALASPFLRSLPLAEHGLEWVQPPLPLAHPLDGGRALSLQHSLCATAANLGRDALPWQRLFGPLVAEHEVLFADILAPLHWPRRPLLLARFGLPGILPTTTLARHLLRTEEARALLAGNAAHGVLPLERSPGSAFALVLIALAQSVGWPSPRGGAQALAGALGSLLRALGGEICTGQAVTHIDELPRARALLFDLTPRQLLRIAGERLPQRYRQALGRYRYGPGVFKLDYALAAPIPWAAPDCHRAGTLHLGGSLAEIAAALRPLWRGQRQRAPLRAARSTEPLRRDARACRPPHGLGLLSRAAWQHGRHDSAGRSADRALRARLPRARAGAPQYEHRAAGAAQREPRRRRHRRRRPGPRAALRAPAQRAAPLRHARQRHLALLLVHATGRRRARHVRLPRSARCPALMALTARL